MHRNKLCLWASLDLLNFDFKLTLDARIQPRFTGREGSCFWLFRTCGHALVTPYVHVLCSNWSNLTGEFMRDIYSASENFFTDGWSWQSFVSSCDVFNCLFLWIYTMKYISFQDSSDIRCWFVYWVFGWELRRLSKSLEIRFRMASFSFFTLLGA